MTRLNNNKKGRLDVVLFLRESAGARTRDPNIKSVVLYLLSYGFIVCQSGYFPFLAVQM